MLRAPPIIYRPEVIYTRCNLRICIQMQYIYIYIYIEVAFNCKIYIYIYILVVGSNPACASVALKGGGV